MQNTNPSSKKVILFSGAILILFGLLAYFATGTKAERPQQSIDPAFNAYISAYTAGMISKDARIRIQFREAVVDSTKVGKQAESQLFKCSPSVSGTAVWVAANMIEFTPDEWLNSGETYTITFRLSEVMEVSDKLAEFSYDLQVIEQDFDVEFLNLQTYSANDLTKQFLSGTIRTADLVKNEALEEILTAKQSGKKLTISWEHAQETHHFKMEQIERREEKSSVQVYWDGKAIGADKEGDFTYDIPALGEFILMNISVVQSPQQHVLLQYSDPLQEKQNLEGLIQIDQGEVDAKFQVVSNQIKIFPTVRQSGERTMEIFEGIKNVQGYAQKESQSFTVTFDQLKPALKLVGKGTIMPKSGKLLFPFEAVSLNAVEVTIIKIFENNIPQFLQVNQLDGSNEIRRVGQLLLRKTIPLSKGGLANVNQWNQYQIDLASLIETEPGAIYQVQLNFKKKHTSFHCEGDSTVQDNNLSSIDDNWDDPYQQEEFSNWNYAESYYYYSDYRWSERDDPCSHSYYYDRGIKRNVLASDFGIIAKCTGHQELFVAITDLKSTQPKGGVLLDVYDYQQQLLASGVTQDNGMVMLKTKGKPFVIVAKQNNQRGYLRVDDGSSLSLSHFDVGGEQVQRGLKGFIYGERGVWRPGDSLFVTCITEDVNQRIPANHPVVFQLKDPMGKVRQKMIKPYNSFGFHTFETFTHEDDPTGNWTASVRIGGAEFMKSMRIETIKPNRLKIKLDFGKEKLTADDHVVSGDLGVTWLHGAVAQNLKAEFKVNLTPVPTQFKKYKGYMFDAVSKSFYADEQTVFDGRINAQGMAKIKSEIDLPENAPGKLMVNFRGKVYEEGGNFSVDRFSLPLYPYESFVGIKLPKGDKARGMLLTDTTHQVQLVCVDADGKPVQRDGIEFSIHKLNWKWWWDQSYEDISYYVSRSYEEGIASGTASTNSKGIGKWSFEIKYPAWGRYYVRAYDPVSGHSCGKVVYIDWPGWAGKAQKDELGASMLTFSSDKEAYQVGEEATLTIPGSDIGRALISIESGSNILESHWLETKQGPNKFKFKVTKEMSPNIYLNVTMVQPHDQTLNDRPIRMHGILPIMVTDPNTHLKPVIKTAEVYAPEKKVSISVSEADGKPMNYTLAVVDEGLLDLTRYKAPNPHDYFYAKEALGINTWDMYEYVVGAMGGKLERILSIGGGAEFDEKPKDGSKANRFKPVVKFFGPFYADVGETKKHEFIMPKYVGSVKVMVVAGHQGAYGNAEQAVPVRESLMVLGTLPRVLGPNEEVALPVNVFAMDPTIKNVQVSVKTNNLLQVMDAKTKSYSFKKEGEQVQYFKLKVKPQLGIAKVTITAQSGNKKATYDVSLDVRNPNPEHTNILTKVIEPGKTWEAKYAAVGIAGTNSGMIEVSQLPAIHLEKRLRYLIRYPHGCVEQTTSSAFPQLFLADIVELSSKQQSNIDKNIKAAIKKLEGFQNASGGFGYWPGESESNAWSTNYTGHFLVEAKSKGFHVNSSLLKNWKKYQKRQAKQWRKQNDNNRDDFVQAYRLYTLALNKSPEMGAMNRLGESSMLLPAAKWRLAAAYAVEGQIEAAEKLIQGLSHEVSPYQELSNTYGSHIRDEAMILETLVALGWKSESYELLKQIADRLSDERQWMSTQTTAFSLMAYSKAAISHTKGEELAYTYTLNGEKANAATQLAISQIEIPFEQDESGTVTIQNTTDGTLYANIILKGKPLESTEPAASKTLGMKVAYTDLKGGQLAVDQIEQGTEFLAKVTFTNSGIRGDLEELALSQVFPSGWEVYNTRMEAHELGGDTPRYQDIRDDRVLTYFDLPKNRSKTFIVRLHASYAGRYYLPAVVGEAMYDNEIHARNAGRWVEVVPANVN